MKRLAVLTFSLIIAIAATAQHATVKGVVNDTLNKQNIEHAVIGLLRSKDSVLYKYVRSNDKGIFELNNLQAGKYLVLVTYPTYADYYDTLTLNDNSNIDLGKVMITTKAHLLADITVVQKIAAVRMRGDTIVYKADSFHMKEGATVEELLKKFPGIQVDKSGNITAQGTKVDKVLVDGEEFFGDDPTIATKNLNASMVNEVQVFDKKSDQATFTGIDDGQTSRTINLKLKDDAKKGWFGKIEAGAGPNDRWNNNVMANTFKNKRKLSFFGIASSTGKTGLNWDEAGKYGNSGDNSNMVMNDDGGIMITNGGGGDGFDNSNYYGEGIPKSWSAGINYSNKYDNDKQSLNGSYRYAKIANDGEGSTISQSILPDTLFFNNEKRNVRGIKDRHSINGSFDWMIDSLFSAKATVSGTKGTSQGWSNYYSEALNATNQFVNNSQRSTTSNGDNKSLKSSLLLRKKFKKIGRTLSLAIDQSYTENDVNGYLYSVQNFYDKTAILFLSDTTDQRKQNVTSANVLSAKATYTEQFSKKFTGEISYGSGINRSQNKVLSFDKGADLKYQSLNTIYSNDYDFTVTTQKPGAMLRFNSKKVILAAGGDIGFTNFNQKDLIKDTAESYNYTNLFPRANFTYKFNPQKRLSINYNGNSKQPTIQQIQPVANNANPLLVQVGNPDLKQQFTHTMNLNFNNWQTLKNRGYWIGLRYTNTIKAISNSQFTDTVGRTTTQYINVNGNYNYGGNAGFNCRLSKWDVSFNVNYNYNRSNSAGIVNGLKNLTKNENHNLWISLGKEKEKLYNIWMSLGFNYNGSTSSIRPDINTNYWGMDHNIEATFQLPLKMEINSEIETEIRQKTALFSGNNNVTVWNMYLAKKFLKNDKGQIRFSAYDMLDQNRGYSRNITSTTLTENNFQQLSRYFLLSFIWNFSKGGAALK